MEFAIAHEFSVAPARVAATLLDLDYQASLEGVGPLKERQVLDQEATADGRVTRHIRCVLDIKIDGPARKLIGDDPPAWIEEATWSPTEMCWSWTINPEVAAKLLAASGTTCLSPNGNNTTVRNVTGVVNVKVPFYGGRVEAWIVDGLERAYDEEALRLESWLDSA